MYIDLSKFSISNQTVGVALSGGGDSMALLNYLLNNSKLYNFSVIAINVEHGIRGNDSIKDTEFVINYCKEHGIPLLTYSVDCKKYAKENNLSLEQAGRILRYDCFYKAIAENKCDLVATAHHLKDNFESVLFNLFRGTALKGLCGIEQNFENKIIRPFLSISKAEIEEYLDANQIPYVVDQTNFCTDYTRNGLRLNVIPEIEKIFPNAQTSAYRFCQIAKQENDYLEEQTLKQMTFAPEKVQVQLPIHPALLSRATIKALKYLGVQKDWEKTHVDSVIALSTGQNGNLTHLKNGIIAIKEYDKVVFIKEHAKTDHTAPFTIGTIDFFDQRLTIETATPTDLTDGFYCDNDKIPQGSVIRTRRDGYKFTKFGGGTKSLNDYLTDKKVPTSIRDTLPLIASGSQVLAIFDLSISECIKVDQTTKIILKLTKEDLQ